MRKPKKRRKNRRQSGKSGKGGGDGGYGVSKSGSGGGGMQSLRSGFKRAAGATDDDRDRGSSTLSNVLWGVVLLGALGVLLYRWFA